MNDKAIQERLVNAMLNLRYICDEVMGHISITVDEPIAEVLQGISQYDDIRNGQWVRIAPATITMLLGIPITYRPRELMVQEEKAKPMTATEVNRRMAEWRRSIKPIQRRFSESLRAMWSRFARKICREHTEKRW